MALNNDTTGETMSLAKTAGGTFVVATLGAYPV